MIDKICTFLTNKIRKEMPEIDDERAEVIMYGLQNIIGELPKGLIILLIAYFLGIFELTLLSILIIAPYRSVSGGVHMKTHIGCIIYTLILYCVPAFLGKNVVLFEPTKYILAFSAWIFCMAMLKLYAPADTENVPILRKKDRKIKKICSYITVVIMTVAAILIKNQIISNMIIIGMLLQSAMITKIAYSIFKVKFGYLEYIKTQKNAI